ncbi:MAG TPA: diaminopimelate epimerase [Bryobacteraceae bacterium]|nr:diaminopimelate epimerase [Bryobacteraceae bacterium]
MLIPFTKAHGALNDFLLTFAADAPEQARDGIAVAICDRHTGVGADGWMIVTPGETPAIELYNSDGSRSEMSGNGTRCAAALLISEGLAGSEVVIMTGAGARQLRLLERQADRFLFEMNMGVPTILELKAAIEVAGGVRDCTLLDVGNPQCAVFVTGFGFDWRKAGAELEVHERFPDRTNVSFVRLVDRNTLDVRFFERGAGETMSSGTGSTGAAAAALARGEVDNPVRVLTPAGPLDLHWHGTHVFLTGPAEITAQGEFHYRP